MCCERGLCCEYQIGGLQLTISHSGPCCQGLLLGKGKAQGKVWLPAPNLVGKKVGADGVTPVEAGVTGDLNRERQPDFLNPNACPTLKARHWKVLCLGVMYCCAWGKCLRVVDPNPPIPKKEVTTRSGDVMVHSICCRSSTNRSDLNVMNDDLAGPE